MDNFSPLWIRKAHEVANFLFKGLCNERGEVVIPFIESVAEESRPAVTNFITSSGVTSEDIANYKTFDEFLSGYKPKQAGDWTSSLEAGHRELVNVKGWKTPGEILKGYSELEKLVGHEKIPMPRKDKDGNYEPGEIDRVMAQLGKPKEAKDYAISKDFKIPEGAPPITDESLGEFKEKAHKLGLLPYQFAGILNYFGEFLGKGAEANRIANEKAHNEAALNLKSKYGSTYDEKIRMANIVLKNFAMDKAQGEAISKKYGNDPIIIGILANVGENLSEEVLTRAGMSGTLLTPEAANLEIKKIKTDPNHPYMKADHPDHQYWVDKMTELYKMASA